MSKNGFPVESVAPTWPIIINIEDHTDTCFLGIIRNINILLYLMYINIVLKIIRWNTMTDFIFYKRSNFNGQTKFMEISKRYLARVFNSV